MGRVVTRGDRATHLLSLLVRRPTGRQRHSADAVIICAHADTNIDAHKPHAKQQLLESVHCLLRPRQLLMTTTNSTAKCHRNRNRHNSRYIHIHDHDHRHDHALSKKTMTISTKSDNHVA